MTYTQTLHILIPVFNEEENMDYLVRTLSNLDKEDIPYRKAFYLLNDGSTDDTVKSFSTLCEEFSLEHRVLSLPHNQGPGAAFRLGFQTLAQEMKEGDLALTMEGDNTSKAELIKTMIHRLKTEAYDVVLASPYSYGGGFKQTGALRIFLSHMANALTKIFLKIHGINTFSSFFRLYSYEALTKYGRKYSHDLIHFNGFESMVEMLAKFVYLELKISEVPMVVDWTHRKGKSKLKVFKTSRNYFKLFFIAKRIIFT